MFTYSSVAGMYIIPPSTLGNTWGGESSYAFPRPEGDHYGRIYPGVLENNEKMNAEHGWIQTGKTERAIQWV